MKTQNSSFSKDRRYVGLQQDMYGGMTPIGGLIKDAWVFGVLPETETCEGWTMPQFQVLHDRVGAEWDKYGLLVSHLPEELRAKHARIHNAAIERAKALGWVPGLDMDSEMTHSDQPVLGQ